jgi:IMP dehydrogenase/GMP reductase
MSSLDFHNVSLVSRQVSSIRSRDEIDTSVEFCGRKLSIPIVASPMLDVCDGRIAKLMMDYGAFGIIHRFSNIAEQVSQYRAAPGSGCAIGINGDWQERFESLYKAGCRIFCLDVANGASTLVIEAVGKIKRDDVYIIAGNLVSGHLYYYLCNNGVSAVRVGVAGGAGCTTKNATGIYNPMISVIKEAYKSKTDGQHTNPIIADGGIKEPADFCKALAFGADVIMLGSLVANCIESPAERYGTGRGGKQYTIYRGSASSDIQSTYRDAVRYIEGRKVLLEYNSERLEELLKRFTEGLRSSMSYFNSRNLTEYRDNMNYVTL